MSSGHLNVWISCLGVEINLSVTSFYMIYKTIRLDENSKGKTIDAEAKKPLFGDLGNAHISGQADVPW